MDLHVPKLAGRFGLHFSRPTEPLVQVPERFVQVADGQGHGVGKESICVSAQEDLFRPLLQTQEVDRLSLEESGLEGRRGSVLGQHQILMSTGCISEGEARLGPAQIASRLEAEGDQGFLANRRIDHLAEMCGGLGGTVLGVGLHSKEPFGVGCRRDACAPRKRFLAEIPPPSNPEVSRLLGREQAATASYIVEAIRRKERFESTLPSDQDQSAHAEVSRTHGARSRAEKLHETLLLAQATSNLGRRKFIAALLELHESKLYLQLGSPSIEQYARLHFGIERSLAFEYLRVARSLRELTRCEADFRSGKLGWSALREITKVASSDSEEEWIAFALKYPGARLRAEVRDAVRKHRSRPRKDGYSLPGLETRLVFELRPEEQDLASKALERAAEEMGERLQGAEVEPKDAFLFLARRFLQEKLDEDVTTGIGERPEASLYTILYHRCPDCRRASLPTAEGPVEIDPGVVERVEADARKVALGDVSIDSTEVGPAAAEESLEEDGQPAKVDRPNSPALVRKVHLRDGRACSNPGCGRTHGLHAHHIVARAQGGATALYNEVLICSTCHAILHAGLLSVEGDPQDGLEWTVPAREQSEDFWARIEALTATTEVRAGSLSPGESTGVDSRSDADAAPCESTRVDSRVETEARFEVVVAALKTLGFSAAQAKRRLERVLESFGQRTSEVSDEELVKAALRCRAA